MDDKKISFCDKVKKLFTDISCQSSCCIKEEIHIEDTHHKHHKHHHLHNRTNRTTRSRSPSKYKSFMEDEKNKEPGG
jgi:hypothetical protein